MSTFKGSFDNFISYERKVLSIQNDISLIKNEREVSRERLEKTSLNFKKAEESLRDKDNLIKMRIELNNFLEKSTELENNFKKYREVKQSFERENTHYLKLKKELEKSNEELKKLEREVNEITSFLSKKANFIKEEKL